VFLLTWTSKPVEEKPQALRFFPPGTLVTALAGTQEQTTAGAAAALWYITENFLI